MAARFMCSETKGGDSWILADLAEKDEREFLWSGRYSFERKIEEYEKLWVFGKSGVLS